MIKIFILMLVLMTSNAYAQTTPTAYETRIGTSCTKAVHSTDFDTFAQCTSTDGSAGTMQKAPLFIGAVTAPPYAAVTCDADKKGMIQHTGTEIQYCDGTTWQIMTTKEYVDAAGGSGDCSAPDAFSFTDQTGVGTGDVISSNVITPTGTSFTCASLASCDNCYAIVRNGVAEGTSTIISPQDTIALQLVPIVIGTAVTTDLTIGSTKSSAWSVTASTTGCYGTTPPVIGTVCVDGSVYAGRSPDNNIPMFTTPADASSTMKWSVGYTIVTGITSPIAGETNTNSLAYLSNADAPYEATRYCFNLNTHGHDDWYLPAKDELAVLYTNKVAIGGFSTSTYWSSTEYSNSVAWRQSFSSGSQLINIRKDNSFRVRCVWR